MSPHYGYKDLFNIINNNLGCGILEEIYTRSNTFNLLVFRLEDILYIIPIFKENSLITKYFIDLDSFSIVHNLLNNKEHLTEKGYNKTLLLKTLKNNEVN